MSTLTRKEGIYTFVIVRGETPRKERKEREKKPNKYKGVVMGMKKLRVGDYIITDNEIHSSKVYQKVANVKYSVNQELGKGLPRRTFEFKSMPEDGGKEGFKVIIKRIV